MAWPRYRPAACRKCIADRPAHAHSCSCKGVAGIHCAENHEYAVTASRDRVSFTGAKEMAHRNGLHSRWHLLHGLREALSRRTASSPCDSGPVLDAKDTRNEPTVQGVR